jgi:hypothetical protein
MVSHATVVLRHQPYCLSIPCFHIGTFRTPNLTELGMLIICLVVIKGGFTQLSSHEDLAMAKKFFEDKGKFSTPVGIA